MKMASITVVACLMSGFSLPVSAQGKFVGPVLKKLIGTTYTDDHSIEGLEDYTFLEGSMISPIEDEEHFSVYVFQKGSTRVIFFSLSENGQEEAQILDMLEIKNVPAGYDIKTVVCREYKQEDVTIVALLKPSTDEYSTDVKQAWRFNRDKIRFEPLDAKLVDCLNEGED